MDSDSPAFFGEPWPSGICDTGHQVPTPIGETCGWCEETIADGDQGTYTYTLDSRGARAVPHHRECQLRSVLGDVAHLQKRCSCYGGTDEDEGLSRRQSAIAAWDWVVEHGVSA